MNPRLIKFAVEMQNSATVEKSKREIHFARRFFNFFKPAKITVPINRNN